MLVKARRAFGEGFNIRARFPPPLLLGLLLALLGDLWAIFDGECRHFSVRDMTHVIRVYYQFISR